MVTMAPPDVVTGRVPPDVPEMFVAVDPPPEITVTAMPPEVVTGTVPPDVPIMLTAVEATKATLLPLEIWTITPKEEVTGATACVERIQDWIIPDEALWIG